MILHLTTQGAHVHLSNGRLAVEKEGETLARVPLAQIQLVVVWGNIGFTTPAWGALVDQGAEVVFLTRYGRFRGRLQGRTTPHGALRRAQYAALDAPAWRLAAARGIVAAKLQHQRSVLQRHRRRKAQVPPEVEQAIAQIQKALSALPHKRSPNALLGLEGTAARAYFRGLRGLFRPPWTFTGRRKRPPPDPVNALLSLGYTLLTQKAHSAVEAVGLDPYAGFLHAQEYGRPALALDLAEEFRPAVDGIVLKVCNQGLLSPREDFTVQQEEGQTTVLLHDEALKRFLQAFEARFAQRFLHPVRRERLTLNQCLVEQAYQLARRLREGRPGYRGMGFR